MCDTVVFPLAPCAQSRFNLVSDPDELHNVVDHPQHAETLKALRTTLMSFLNSTPGFFADLKATIEVCVRAGRYH